MAWHGLSKCCNNPRLLYLCFDDDAAAIVAIEASWPIIRIHDTEPQVGSDCAERALAPSRSISRGAGESSWCEWAATRGEAVVFEGRCLGGSWERDRPRSNGIRRQWLRQQRKQAVRQLCLQELRIRSVGTLFTWRLTRI